jgi:hypothetical protein
MKEMNQIGTFGCPYKCPSINIHLFTAIYLEALFSATTNEIIKHQRILFKKYKILIVRLLLSLYVYVWLL